ncbi:unnamed protein product, partial [marine sediment metagenome]
DHPAEHGQQATTGPIKEVATGIALALALEIVLGPFQSDPGA